MKHLFKNPLFYVCLILFLAVSFLVVDFVGATTSFSEPTELFPGGNPELPIDIGPVSQTKEGELTVNELIITPAGNLYLNGSGICMKENLLAPSPVCKSYWDQIITAGVINGDSLQIHTYGSGRSGSDLPGTYTARNVFFDDVYSESETGWPGSYGSLITFMGRSGHEGLQIFQMPSYTADLRVRSTWYDQSSGWGSWRTVAFTDSPSFSGNVGIGDTSPDGGLKLDVEGKVGATEYCDEDGNNCFPSQSVRSSESTRVIMFSVRFTRGGSFTVEKTNVLLTNDPTDFGYGVVISSITNRQKGHYKFRANFRNYYMDSDEVVSATLVLNGVGTNKLTMCNSDNGSYLEFVIADDSSANDLWAGDEINFMVVWPT